ncbi:MAG: dihydrodipicolinate synthase family protein [Treponema sp.]|jgi:dihydrodipicolinate synthase/N-acetylneuraminate lyase|nr:dihydrodipicolinate synthase family protein [Treponema sp.]
MKAKEFIGIIPPALSSFDKDGVIYEKGIRENIRFILPYVNGLYPVGTYGCGPCMDIAERKKVLEIILDEVNGKVPVVAHVGTADTKTTCELACHAKHAGASGVGAISPYYSPNLSEEAMYRHFAALVDSVNETEFPVFIYNNHHLSQNSITPKLLKRLAEHGLRGCKDSSFDIVNYYLFHEAIKDYDDFNLIIGTEAIFVAAFDAGATGCVCGMANIFPEILKGLRDAYLAGDRVRAMELQYKILEVRTVTKAGPTVPIMHAILSMRGINSGIPRSPYIEISDELKTSVRKSLEKLELL